MNVILRVMRLSKTSGNDILFYLFLFFRLKYSPQLFDLKNTSDTSIHKILYKLFLSRICILDGPLLRSDVSKHWPPHRRFYTESVTSFPGRGQEEAGFLSRTKPGISYNIHVC
jgi:hypothetical protein